MTEREPGVTTDLAPEPGVTTDLASEPALAGRIRGLLHDVRDGRVSPEVALESLKDLPFSDLGFARLDHHRELRQGAVEFVYAPGKTVEHVEAIVVRLLDANEGSVLVTRATPEQAACVAALARNRGLTILTRPEAGLVALPRAVPEPRGRLLILAAGTADLPVAREAELVARLLGAGTHLVVDVGVAGVHRLLAELPAIREADVIVAVAGMEGALPSVVGGLASVPVIACPTSVGYGASFGGLAALLAMLSSCVPGTAVVGIDDGVGAGTMGALIARAAGRARPIGNASAWADHGDVP
jgi:pyridinium-3,5-biscarboxylic acid mononucleotide synthase